MTSVSSDKRSQGANKSDRRTPIRGATDPLRSRSVPLKDRIAGRSEAASAGGI